MTIKAVRGFKDILPDATFRWQVLEECAREVFETFGVQEIRTPILEKTEVFARGIGQHTDIVEKEMYTFEDRSGDSLTLRPEATAGIVRSVIEHGLHGKSALLKLFTIGPMFRHERPQKGRLRQFHQINVELLGSQSPMADTEVIWMAWQILQEMEVSGLRLEINSLGCPKCRPLHKEELIRYLEGAKDSLCPDCKRRSETNPLRVFDCKLPECKEIMVRAPLIKHCLCPDCADHLGKALDGLEAVSIPFVINPYLVRGLDYYTRTTFEIVAKGLGAQSTVAAGGRYDGLVRQLGGPDISGVGMAIGVERLMLLLDETGEPAGADLFICALGPEPREIALGIMKELRDQGFRVEMSYEDKGLKAQMKQAARTRASYALIIGEDEMDDEKVVLRDMKSGTQQDIALEDAGSTIAGVLLEQEEEE